MLDILNSIQFDELLKQRVIALANKHKGKILTLADKCNDGKFECLRYKNDLVRLAVMLECTEKMRNTYKTLGIDDRIFLDTVDDIRIWCENNGNKGLKNYNWIKNHISCELFKIGRLQYQLCTCKSRMLKYDLLPFDYGEKVIYVHIPQGEKLIYADCVKSLKMAKVFFEKYFPDYNYRFFFCESWLLYDENFQFMQPSSNILQFSSLFDVAYSCDMDAQAIERIFGKRCFDKKKYPENTALQRNAKAYILNGGKLGVGIGVIDKADI
ncbi:MAG: acyltransferase domain-containing protein [Eubacterium sp.]|nr:acyltransferase domain-containing protein [Eubacterium sp.]